MLCLSYEYNDSRLFGLLKEKDCVIFVFVLERARWCFSFHHPMSRNLHPLHTLIIISINEYFEIQAELVINYGRLLLFSLILLKLNEFVFVSHYLLKCTRMHKWIKDVPFFNTTFLCQS